MGSLAALLFCAHAAQAVTCETRIFGTAPFTACRVDLKSEQLSLFWRDEAGLPYRQFSALRDALESHGKQLLFAVNAGMYLPDFSPVGLFVANGREWVPLNRHTGSGNFSQQPNGVFLIEGNYARVITTDAYWREKPKPLLATQSGPMLVHEGQITTSEVMKPNSSWRKLRNGVCAPSPDTVVFAISESAVTFYEFASYFRDFLQCREALYLDGSISSLYAPSFNREDHGWDMGPILAIVGSQITQHNGAIYGRVTRNYRQGIYIGTTNGYVVSMLGACLGVQREPASEAALRSTSGAETKTRPFP